MGRTTSAHACTFLFFVTFALVWPGLIPASQQQAQLTPVPPKPTCTVILRNGACANLWNAYNQAFAQRQREELQLYVDRQKELASEAATAPLQQQIADLTKLTSDQQTQIGSLQKQMETEAATALEAKQAGAAAARKQGLVEGLEIGLGGALGLIVVTFGVARFFKSTLNKDSRVPA